MTSPQDTAFVRTVSLLRSGIADAAYPAVVCEVGRCAGPVWRYAAGRQSYDDDAGAVDEATIFDLASLTKVIATTSLVMRQVATAQWSLDTPVRDLLPWTPPGSDAVTIRHLLDHSAGLPAHVPLWQQATGAAALKALALRVPLERPVGTAAGYSDVGFLLLGFALEAATRQPLDRQWRQLRPADWPFLDYCPPVALRPTIAPTEDDSWRGRRLQGEVHDENAAVLGGVAAHAGLFGSAAAVGRFGADVLRTFREPTWLATPELMRAFAARQAVPGSSRALGWDTMLPTSSCGTRLSQTSIGHTGFTGTSLWIDWERDLYVVLLTNRVHPTRRNDRFPPMRAWIHDAIAEDVADLND